MTGINEDVGARIRALMEQRGLTAKELAAVIGIHEGNLYHLLHGRSGIKPGVALRMAEYFGVTLDELYARAPLPEPVTVYLRLRAGEDRETAIHEVEEAVRRIRQEKEVR